jgi:hypothetical protein
VALLEFLRAEQKRLLNLHVVHRVVDAADAVAGMFETGKRHPVDAKGGVFVDHNSTCVEPPKSVHGYVDIAGANSSLERKGQSIRSRNCIVNVGVGINTGDRSEGFLGADPRLAWRIEQDSHRIPTR